MSIHLIVSEDRYRCGKRPVFNSSHSTSISEVTCKTCKEAHSYENGKIREYRMGGNFGKDLMQRKHQNHWDYKETVKALTEENQKLREGFSLLMEIIDWAEWAQDNTWYSNRDKAAEIWAKLNIKTEEKVEN